MKGHVNSLKLLIELGQADINARNEVRHITVSYELFPLMYDILMWHLTASLIPRLLINSIV